MSKYGKIRIKGKINVVTGMHIGGSAVFAAIGAVDSPVVRDIVSNLPMIPGSSLKGKMRILLAKKYNEKIDKDDDRINKLFGSAAKENGKTQASRIQISDMIMDNFDELKKRGLMTSTEVKFENSIDRRTAKANPRQIERVVRGAEFPIDIIYNIENFEENEDIELGVEEDLNLILEAMRLIQFDYIGGNGSRGYGKVKFENIEAMVVENEIYKNICEKFNKKCRGELE